MCVGKYRSMSYVYTVGNRIEAKECRHSPWIKWNEEGGGRNKTNGMEEISQDLDETAHLSHKYYMCWFRRYHWDILRAIVHTHTHSHRTQHKNEQRIEVENLLLHIHYANGIYRPKRNSPRRAKQILHDHFAYADQPCSFFSFEDNRNREITSAPEEKLEWSHKIVNGWRFSCRMYLTKSKKQQNHIHTHTRARTSNIKNMEHNFKHSLNMRFGQFFAVLKASRGQSLNERLTSQRTNSVFER